MKRSTRAAILCGQGKTAESFSEYIQKVMTSVGPKETPLLGYTVGLFARSGVKSITLLTGPHPEIIRRSLGYTSTGGAHITYSRTGPQAGSLNVVANALKDGTLSGSGDLLIYHGEILSDLNVTKLLSEHRSKGADATLVVSKGYSLPVGVAEVKAGSTVASLKEKPALDLNVATGCVVLGPNGIAMAKRMGSPRRTDLMSDFIPGLLDGGLKVASYVHRGTWFDAESVGSLDKLNEEVARRRLSLAS